MWIVRSTHHTACLSYTNIWLWFFFPAKCANGGPKRRGVNKHQYNKLEKLLHLIGDLFEFYDYTRTCKVYLEIW